MPRIPDLVPQRRPCPAAIPIPIPPSSVVVAHITKTAVAAVTPVRQHSTTEQRAKQPLLERGTDRTTDVRPDIIHWSPRRRRRRRREKSTSEQTARAVIVVASHPILAHLSTLRTSYYFISHARSIGCPKGSHDHQMVKRAMKGKDERHRVADEDYDMRC